MESNSQKSKLNLTLQLTNFLAIERGKLESDTQLTFIIAPNRGGKTQLLYLLYSFFWSLWMGERAPFFEDTLFFEKLKKCNFGSTNFTNWNSDRGKIEIGIDNRWRWKIGFLDNGETGFQSLKPKERILKRAPIYLNPAGLGDYYKGIFALRKFYPGVNLVPEGVVDLIDDLLIVGGEKVTPSPENEELLNLFQQLFQSSFSISSEKVFITEQGHRFGIERTASGLKSLGWLYLIIHYNLLGEILLIDEPEVNLHPVYIDRLALFLYQLARGRKVIVATHSDYLLESVNKLLLKKGGKVTVWEGQKGTNGFIYRSYRADSSNLINTDPLNEIYLQILAEGFGFEG